MAATLGPFEIKMQGEVPVGSTITAISFSPDGKFVALADEHGLVTVSLGITLDFNSTYSPPADPAHSGSLGCSADLPCWQGH